MPRAGAKDFSECLYCKPGYECKTAGTVTPTNCPNGYFCEKGTSTSIT